jgi:hypothetical protein
MLGVRISPPLPNFKGQLISWPFLFLRFLFLALKLPSLISKSLLFKPTTRFVLKQIKALRANKLIHRENNAYCVEVGLGFADEALGKEADRIDIVKPKVK